MTTRQLAALETRLKLLDANKKIIYEKGLMNTSVEEITAAPSFPKELFILILNGKKILFLN